MHLGPTAAQWRALIGVDTPTTYERIGADRGMSSRLWRVVWPGGRGVLKCSHRVDDGRRERQALDLLASTGRVPRLLSVAASDHQIWLLIEDLGALEAGDMLQGPTDAQALAAVQTLGVLHARWWDRPPVGWPRGIMRWPAVSEGACAIWLRRFPHPAAADVLARLPEAIDGARTTLAAAPVGLMHADAHLDNWMFGLAPDPSATDQDESTAQDEPTAVLIDWETARVGPCVVDMVRFLVEGVHTAQRRRLSDALLATWRARVPTIDDAVLSAWIDAALWYSLNAVVAHCARVDGDELPPRMRQAQALCAQQIMDFAADRFCQGGSAA